MQASWLGAVIIGLSWGLSGILSPSAAHADFAPCDPVSEFLDTLEGEPDPGFCSEWNPEFGFRSARCCPKVPPRRSRRRERCSPTRVKVSYCDEMTEEQKRYVQAAYDGKLGDVLALITLELGKVGSQAYCSVNQGFLAWGRRIIPSLQNRLRVKSPERCLDFGTDQMVGMLEWVGRQVAQKYPLSEYPGAFVSVGAVSAPRGGCISGRGGRRAHASHTSGQDADLGFFNVSPGRAMASKFTREFNAESNWWFLKQVFDNPFACVKAVFLDKRLIRKLEKAAFGDAKWREVRPFIQHTRGHRNHFHIRVGDGAGGPGCKPDLEDAPDLDSDVEDDDELPESPAGSGTAPKPKEL